MTERLDDVECVVIALVDQLVRTAVRFAHDHIETADALPDMPSAETWRNIADAIDNPRGREDWLTLVDLQLTTQHF